jgi:hypothetical protein
VEKVEIPLRLRDFQAQWESPAFGLFHGAVFSTALLPTDCAIDPKLISVDEYKERGKARPDWLTDSWEKQ